MHGTAINLQSRWFVQVLEWLKLHCITNGFYSILDGRSGVIGKQSDLSPFVTLSHSQSSYIIMKVSL